MARTHSAVVEMSQIAQVHNQLRRASRSPGPVASSINENTVVRVAAVMEHHLEKRFRRKVTIRQQPRPSLRDLLGPWDAGTDWPDICMRTLFVLRHFIVHHNGRYRPHRL